MKKALIIFAIVFLTSLKAQVILTDYQETENEIRLKLELNETKLLTRNGANGFFDESKPGYFAVPSKSILIGIPFSKSYNISTQVLKEEKKEFLLGINPEVGKKNDEELKYNFLNQKIYNGKPKPIFEIKGYFWLDEIYCVNIEINQYDFDDINSIISQIDEIEIKIEFQERNKLLKADNNKNIPHLNSLVNSRYASKYLGKPINIITEDDTTDYWIDYYKEYLKMGVAIDGIYRLTKSNLEENGLNIQSINPKTFKLFSKGKEIPIYVKGELDISFDNEDYIEFLGLRNYGGKHREVSNYGEPYNEYLGRYSDTTVYWLSWDGAEGQRVETSNGELSAVDTLLYYSQIDHYEINSWFDFSAANQVRRENPYWTENKTWNEGNLNIGIRNKNFTVSEVYPDNQFKAYIKLQDFASDISSKAHLISLGLNTNETWSDSTYLNKYEQSVINFQWSTSLLNPGSNTLTINSIATESTINLCVFDWYEIEYPRYLKPVNNSLNFSFPYLQNIVAHFVKLQNISADNFSIWKYGDQYKKFTPNKIGNQIIFSDTISANNKFSYSDESKILTPKIYYKKLFQNLRSTNNKADYIAITHKKFKSKVNEYSDFISTNYEVLSEVIDIDDIYDEYAYGFFNPEAIKEFLKSTHNYWQNPKPKYVVLIGGATYDYYGNKFKNLSSVKERVLNYVPSFGAPVSDNWFVTWDTTGAYMPQMNIGRIPVTSNDELDWYFDKHSSFVTQGYDDWNKRYLFFSSGDAKNTSELTLLKESNQFVIDNYANTKPIGGVSTHFYKTVEPKTNFGPYSKEFFQNTIDNGAVFISYLGHSGTQIWDNTIVTPLQLKNNRNRYPIVSDFGCSTSKFGEPDIISFSELFTVSQEGQALTYIGNASLGFLSTAIAMPKLFYKKILADSIYNVSDALNEAKLEMLQNFGSSGVYELFALTNTLIGDPILSLSIPDKPNFVIEQKDVELNSQSLSDLQDSAEIKFKYHNYGTAINDSIQIQIENEFNNIKKTNSVKVVIPNFEDSLKLSIPIKNQAGSHSIKIKLDEPNEFNEISENDNNLDFAFNVGSSLIRPLLDYQFLNGIYESITFLNPTSNPKEEIFIFDISNSPSFSNLTSKEISFDSLYSKYTFTNLEKNKRYFGKTKIKGGDNYSTTFSFLNSPPKYFQADSISFSNSIMNNLQSQNDTYLLDSNKITFELFSAGFDDGQAAIISRNDVNYVPTPLVGHHIALFNSSPPFEFVEYKYFNTLAGGENTTNYIQFLDTLTNKYLVAIAISDEGSPRSDELKDQIKSLGSQYIDQVGWRSSWAFIGKKGAIVGSMPEAISKSGDGPVSIDSTISFITDDGNLLTTEIGTVGKWQNLVIQDSLPNNSSISYKPILISQNDNTEDTLAALNIVNGEAALSFIDAEKYPHIKILAEFEAGDNNTSPELYSLGVDYFSVPELAINYQVVSVEKDTVQQGEDANLQFYVYNVGESTADSFKVTVDVVKPDNSKEKIFEEIVDSIGSEKRKKFNIAYPTTNFNGARTFAISIDTEEKVHELYEDNNFYNIPFYVVGDTTKPTMNLTFDGNDIFDGEYISSQPKIKIELSEPSLVPITDTSSISIFLNNKYVNYFGNENNVSVSFSQTNPKVTVNYTPTLEDGEYTLRVFGKDASGNVGDSSGISKSFNVQSEAKLLNVYNYPNPFNNDTYFTFKLTQIPDDIRIKVFTIAGRLIKEIELNGSQLNYDLNKIYWDGRDDDGDLIGNGVYLYKVIMDVNGKKQDVTQKLAIVR